MQKRVKNILYDTEKAKIMASQSGVSLYQTRSGKCFLYSGKDIKPLSLKEAEECAVEFTGHKLSELMSNPPTDNRGRRVLSVEIDKDLFARLKLTASKMAKL